MGFGKKGHVVQTSFAEDPVFDLGFVASFENNIPAALVSTDGDNVLILFQEYQTMIFWKLNDSSAGCPFSFFHCGPYCTPTAPVVYTFFRSPPNSFLSFWILGSITKMQ